MAANTWTPNLSDVTHHWSKAVATAEEEVVAFFPYVTSIQVINKIPDSVRLHLYTVFSIENFASGASCFHVLKKIFRRPDTSVYHLEGLHAKLVFVDDELVSVGSQNLTARGKKNREATVLSPTPLDARQQRRLEQWQAEAVLLTPEMMEEMQILLPESCRAYHEYQERLTAAEDAVTEALVTMTQDRLGWERIIQTAHARFQSSLDLFRKRLASSEDGVNRAKAERIVLDCTWIRNSFGRGPVRMRTVGDRLYWSENLGWCWNSSGRNDTNKFSINMAYRSADLYFEEFLRRERWRSLSLDDVRRHLKSRFHGHVYNLNDDAYHDYTLERDQDVIFWGYSFDLVDLTNYVIDEFQLETLYAAWKDLQELEDSHAP